MKLARWAPMVVAALKTELGNVATFGPSILLRHVLAKDDAGAVRLRTAAGTWSIRPRNSDLSVLRQVFRRRDYDLSRYAQFKRFEERYREILAASMTPVIIDAGANIGAASVWYADRFPLAKVVAVEPEPANALLCRRNTEGRENITVRQAAIGAEQGTVSIVCDDGAGWAVQTRVDPAGSTPVVTVNQLVEECGSAAALLLVKIDIEGFESELFASGTEWVDKTFAIVAELHDYQMPGQHSSRTMQRALFDRGFEIVISGENLFFVR